MTCEQCSRPMRPAPETQEWWCPHCHHRVPAETQPAPQPQAQPAPQSPAPADRTPPPERAPSAVPVRADTGGSEPVVVPPPGRTAQSVIAILLAVVAVGMVIGALVRCGQGGNRGGVDADTVMRLVPPGGGVARGTSLSSLRRSELGRQILETMRDRMLSPTTEKACGLPVEALVRDIVRVDHPEQFFGGYTLARTRVTEKEVNECARKAADELGQTLEIQVDGKLRGYDFGDRPFWVAWLDDRTILLSAAWKPHEQREQLHSILERDGDPTVEEALARAVRRVDTSASFWAAVARPSGKRPAPSDWDFDEGGKSGLESWYDDRLGGLLGARPDAVYLSLDVDEDRLELRGGAVYASGERAERVAERMSEQIRLLAIDSVRIPDLGEVDPTLQDAIARRLEDSARKAQIVRTALLDGAEVGADGEIVTFRARIDGQTYEELREARSAQALVDEIGAYLPAELALGL